MYQNRHRKEDTHEGLAAPYGRGAPGRERREPRRPDGPPRKDILSSWRMIARRHTKPSPERGRWPEGPDEVASQPSPESRGRLFPFIRETLNKSSAAGQRIFCPHAALRKVGNTQSIPPLFEACLWTKSLAASSCRFNQSFPRQLFAAPDAGFSEFIQSDKKVLAISRIYWYNICNWYVSQNRTSGNNQPEEGKVTL